jgi:predicted aspartyl protease
VRTVLAILAAIAATGNAGAAEHLCQIGKLLELPVIMVDRRPTVMATLDGHPLRLTVDSGAFFSSLSPSVAARYGFERHPAPRGLRVIGIGGEVETEVTTIKDFKLGRLALHRVDFLVGGGQVGPAGLLGQNILGIADVEYDLAAGAVRLMRPKDCDSHVNLAYWASGKPVSLEKIDSSDSAQKHTQGTVVLNGVKLTAMFDTGAPTSLLSRRAAARVGVKPGGAGVVEDAYLGGLGRGRIQIWTGPFDSLQIGDNETIRKIRLRFGDLGDMGDIDMLIGADFFLSHRVYVSNKLHAMFFTYNGGPVFDLTARSAPASP